MEPVVLPKKLGDYTVEKFRELVEGPGVVADADKPAWLPKTWKLLVPLEEMTPEFVRALRTEVRWARVREVKDLTRAKREPAG
ncbi:MAG: hypothetical protein BGO81_13435 [Devosia sp. 66-22]|nr:MAG: hypothetical protein BGO81_13435 [Devosia sp. 66-22]